mgnify:CR=1 FL=1|jgi:hypothetical protein
MHTLFMRMRAPFNWLTLAFMLPSQIQKTNAANNTTHLGLVQRLIQVLYYVMRIFQPDRNTRVVRRDALGRIT